MLPAADVAAVCHRAVELDLVDLALDARTDRMTADEGARFDAWLEHQRRRCRQSLGVGDAEEA